MQYSKTHLDLEEALDLFKHASFVPEFAGVAHASVWNTAYSRVTSIVLIVPAMEVFCYVLYVSKHAWVTHVMHVRCAFIWVLQNILCALQQSLFAYVGATRDYVVVTKAVSTSIHMLLNDHLSRDQVQRQGPLQVVW